MTSYRSFSGTKLPPSDVLYRDVRHAVLGMGGLKTVQSVISYKDNGDSNGTVFARGTLMDPESLFDNVHIIPNSNEKFYIQSAESILYVSNSTNAPAVVRAYRLCCTKNCSTEINVLLAEDAPSPFKAYIDATTSSAFRRYFHVAESRVDFLPVQGCLMYELSDYFLGGKLVTWDVEANLDQFSYTVGSQLWILYINSQPVEDTSSYSNAGPASVEISFMNHWKYTYYVLQNNDPSSVAVSTLVPVNNGRVISDASSVVYQTDNSTS